MNKSFKHGLIAVTLLTAAASLPALAGPGGRDGFGPGGCDKQGGYGQMAGVMQLENLSDEQKAKLQELRRTQRDTMQGQRNKMRDSRQALHNAMSDGAERATIEKLAKEQGKAVEAMILQRYEMRQQVNAILTKEQREELANSDFGQGPRHYGGHRGQGYGW